MKTRQELYDIYDEIYSMPAGPARDEEIFLFVEYLGSNELPIDDAEADILMGVLEDLSTGG